MVRLQDFLSRVYNSAVSLSLLYSLVSLRTIDDVARAPRYVRQARAVGQGDRRAQAVEDGVSATPVDQVLVRVRASLGHFRRFRLAVGDRHLAQYARYALNIALLRPVEFNGAQLVTDRLGFHQQLARLHRLLPAVLQKRSASKIFRTPTTRVVNCRDEWTTMVRTIAIAVASTVSSVNISRFVTMP